MSETTEVEKKPAKKAALGRGLGVLLGGSQEAVASPATLPPSVTPAAPPVGQVPETARIWQISIDKLSPQPHQPRRVFAQGPLEELAQSIRTQGILQPIVARRRGADSFQIIAGERRWRAAQLAGLHEVPVILQNSGDQKSLELALIENIQRQDLNPMEEAMAFSHLMETYHLTQQQLSEKIGKDRATIANTLRLLQLCSGVREMVNAGEVSMGQAKVLLAVTDPLSQKKLALKIVREKLSVRACERLIAKHMESVAQGEMAASQPEVTSRSIASLREELQKIVGSKVTIDYILGKGRVSIHFYSDDELNQITDKVRRSWLKPNP